MSIAVYKLSQQQKLEILEAYHTVKKVIEMVAPPELKNEPIEKKVTFMKELNHVEQLGAALGEEFFLCSNSQQKFIDAISDSYSVQLKNLGGHSRNARMVRMPKKKTVGQFVAGMFDASEGRSPLFSFKNKTLRAGSFCKAENFWDRLTTYLMYEDVEHVGEEFQCY